MKRILIITILFLLFPAVTLADSSCSNQDKEYLQKLANNVTYYVEETKNYDGTSNYLVKITFSGVSNELFFKDNNHNIFLNSSDTDFGEFTTNNIEPNQAYKMYIYGRNKCVLDTLRVITINIPKINMLHYNNLCSEYGELNVCQKWTNEYISVEQFNKVISEYENKKNVNNDDIQEQNTFWLYDIYQKYYWYGLIGLIIILASLIYFWIKEQNKNKL